MSKIKNAKKENNTKINKKRKEIDKAPTFNLIEVIIIVLITSVVVSISSGLLIFNNYENISEKRKDSNNIKYKKEIEETFDKITNDYVKTINKEELANAALEGMFKYLDDPYSNYLNKNQTEELTEKLEGTYEGIGIEIRNTKFGIEIERVFDHSPAQKAGIKKGDIITKINETSLKGKDANYLSNYIKYKSVDKIKIEAKRKNKTKKFLVSKSDIDYPVVYTEKYDKTGYVYISAFSKTSSEQFKTSINELEEKGIKSLVIDLRNNTGGYLNEAYEIAEQFLARGKTVYQLKDKKNVKKYKTNNPDKKNYKVTILINNRSASASEVLALALKENYKAILVGEKSYGKGSVQQTKELDNGSMVKYTTAKWLSPSGKTIDGVGIVPDVNIIYSPSKTEDIDNQLKKAIELVK